MGHRIQCFIGSPVVIETILNPLAPIDVVLEDLPQGFQCLFLCDKLRSSIQEYKHMNDITYIEPFHFFSSAIKGYLEDNKENGVFVYIETDYFGGEGTQASGFFKDGQLIEVYEANNSHIDVSLAYPDRLLMQPINRTLRRLGVVRDMIYDEFDTLGLAEHRYMPDHEI